MDDLLVEKLRAIARSDQAEARALAKVCEPPMTFELAEPEPKLTRLEVIVASVIFSGIVTLFLLIL